MAKKEDTMSTEIAIDGEREYKAACKDIKDSLNLIGSEMKVVTAEFGTNAKSVEGLTAKQNVLNKRLSEQEKQVKAAADALEKFKAAGEAGAGGAQKMETKLNEAKAAMIKTQKELDETGKQLDDAGKDATEFSEDVKKAGNETDIAGGKFSKLGGVLGKVGKAFGTGVVAIGTAAAGVASAFAASTVAGSNYADDLLTQSAYTRQSAEDLQKYAYAARFVDVDMNMLTKSMAKNIKSMDNARGGTGAIADAYKKLGVTVTHSDGSLKNSNEVYWQTIDALKGVANETERDALAMQILGKNGTELNSVIEAGSEKFKSYGAEAEKMGAVMSEDQLNKLGAFNDKIQVLSAGMDGLKNASSLIALPFLDVMAGEGIGILGDFTSGINAANGDMGKMAEVVGETIASIVNMIAEQLPAFIDMGVSMLQSLVKGIVENLPAITAAAVEVVVSLCDGLIEMLPLLLEGAIQIIAGLAQGISDALPQLIPKIVEMLLLMVQTLVDNMPLLIDCAVQLITGLATGLLNALPVLIDAIPPLINSLVSALLGYMPQLIKMWVQLFSSLIAALPEILIALGAAVPQIIEGLAVEFGKLIGKFAEIGANLIKGIWDGICTTGSWLGEKISELFGSLVDKGAEFAATFIGNAKQSFTDGWNAIVEFFTEGIPAFIQSVVDWIGELPEKIGLFIKQTVEKFVQFGKDLINWSKTEIPKFITTIVDFIAGLPGQIWKWLCDTVKSVAQWARDLIRTAQTEIPKFIESIIKTIASLPQRFYEMGVNVVNGIWNGIKSMGSWLWNQISGFFNGIVQGVKDALGIRSPSKVFAGIGEFMAMGLGDGFSKKMGSVGQNIRNAIPTDFDLKSRVTYTEAHAYAMTGVGVGTVASPAGFYMQLNKMLDEKFGQLKGETVVNVEVRNELDGEEIAAKTTTRVSENLTTDIKRRR